MATNSEADATGSNKMSFESSKRGLTSRQKVSADLDLSMPGINDLAKAVGDLSSSIDSLSNAVSKFSTSKMRQELKELQRTAREVNSAVGGISAGGGSLGGGLGNSRGGRGGESDNFRKAQNATGGGDGGGTTGYRQGPGPGATDAAFGEAAGAGTASAASSASLSSQGGWKGLLGGLAMNALKGYGALNAAGVQYGYNRIEGPTGNRNAMLQLAQALGPNAGMMGMNITDLIKGLSQRTPVMGSNADVVGTILAGQSVGALMKGTPQRSGFFESVRQMQTLTPGVGAGQLAGTLSNYIGNTGAQQMGMYMGEGAFTMIGKGGRYKSLAEWAEGITKFMSEQRIIGVKGGEFTRDQLISQNFPGSNINAWFQMMGVPAQMVDYWWQYAIANAGRTSPASVAAAKQNEQLQTNVTATRGMDLSQERLKNITQSTRREFLLGNYMYDMYGARESSDRRFNVAMQGADLQLGSMFRNTRAGNLMALMPTPAAELLMSLLGPMLSSPVGAAASIVGNIFGGGISQNPFGDPIGDPVGDYGDRGGTSTKHLSPDLSKRISAMMKANPRLKISSGYRDTHTQNRLRRQGGNMVGPASTSKHTRGWAADLGPTSELGWVEANAGKFGLQTASNAGEPWHVQMAGTMSYGDPETQPIGDIFDWLKDKAGAVIGGASDMLGGQAFGGSIDLIKGLLGSGSGQDLAGSIDKIISGLIKMMLFPMSGLFKASNMFGGEGFSSQQISDFTNSSYTGSIKVPRGFGSTPSIGGGDQIFGDPIYDMARTRPTSMTVAPVIFKTDVNVTGGISSGMDAQRTAVSLADHLEAEFARRDWRRS
jgi:hypothetical protein